MIGIMKQATLILTLALGVFASAANAACIAEYKAKRGTEYVHSRMSVPDDVCSTDAAQSYVASALSAQGMQLLAIVKVTPDS